MCMPPTNLAERRPSAARPQYPDTRWGYMRGWHTLRLLRLLPSGKTACFLPNTATGRERLHERAHTKKNTNAMRAARKHISAGIDSLSAVDDGAGWTAKGRGWWWIITRLGGSRAPRLASSVQIQKPGCASRASYIHNAAHNRRSGSAGGLCPSTSPITQLSKGRIQNDRDEMTRLGKAMIGCFSKALLPGPGPRRPTVAPG
ncbi:hypothetical protein GGTG_01446 [Gaeumannomyces tritici R3-111a-1]|uniref:Uncharacterized protein n=1 Tax=Gaeumannomyces tritici (strain R3-111a-1) TaxID=644352 RepID=J3NJL6_GAET3|nr:hypothetical protein GGTG_01446 [Gaeumannomyces tritici R3-111a-1]EJT81468.1 hypothetical protein GGTG_01446 [Gaeumannomyces tritici R3-111a-1]